MLTIKELIQKAGGADAILSRSAEYSTPAIRDPSTIRHWVANGVPPRWYTLMSDLSGISIADVHKASEAARRKQPLAQAS